MIFAYALVATLAMAGTTSQGRPAADGSTVAVVHAANTTELARRVEAEMRLLGLRVRRVTSPLERTANHGLSFPPEVQWFVVIFGVPHRLELWSVAGRHRIKRVTRELETYDPKQPGVTALWIAELLRPYLIAVHPAPRRPFRAPLAVSGQPPTRYAKPKPPSVDIGLRMDTTWSTSSGSVGGRLRLNLVAPASGAFGVSIDVGVPLWPERIVRQEGKLALWPVVVGAALRARTRLLASRISLSGALGVAGAAVVVQSTAATGFTARDSVEWTTLPYLETSVGLDLGSGFAAEVGVRASVAVPRPTFRFAGGEIGRWAQPNLALGFGVRRRF